MTRRPLFIAAGMCLVAGLGLAEAQQQAVAPITPVSFEVASIKERPTIAGEPRVRLQPGGRYDALNVAPRFLITYAYQLQPFQLVGGPDWVRNDRFDITAKMEGEPQPVLPGTGPDQAMLAMRTLLAERFK